MVPEAILEMLEPMSPSSGRLRQATRSMHHASYAAPFPPLPFPKPYSRVVLCYLLGAQGTFLLGVVREQAVITAPTFTTVGHESCKVYRGFGSTSKSLPPGCSKFAGGRLHHRVTSPFLRIACALQLAGPGRLAAPLLSLGSVLPPPPRIGRSTAANSKYLAPLSCRTEMAPHHLWLSSSPPPCCPAEAMPCPQSPL